MSQLHRNQNNSEGWLKLHVGCGNVRLNGFTNVDLRPTDAVDARGHASDLSAFADGSVRLLFAHALFEHVFLAHHLMVLSEWRRVLAEAGSVICLGIPDFEAVARLYLDKAAGVVGERFDLHNVYRYTHGEPEHACPPAWATFDPLRRPNAGPSGYLPQLHKALFDASYVRNLTRSAGFSTAVFRYAYPGEEHALNLGFVARSGAAPTVPKISSEIVESLSAIPTFERYIRPETVALTECDAQDDGQLGVVLRLGNQRAPSLLQRVRRRATSALHRRAVTS